MSSPAPANQQGSISLTGVSVRLGGVDVLREIDLEIPAGQMIAFIGPSGAGKTTLLRLLNGGIPASAGSVVVGGLEVQSLAGNRLRDLRRGIGFIHQDLRLVPNLRVSQNVLSGKLGGQNFWQSARMFIMPTAADLAQAHRLLERVGIPEKIFQRVDQLSGGQAQRVAVARALIQDPFLVAADEPVSSVDPARAREVLELLTGICRQDGLTLCVSLHDPVLVKEFFHRVVGLRAGKAVLDTPAAELNETMLARLYSLEDGYGV